MAGILLKLEGYGLLWVYIILINVSIKLNFIDFLLELGGTLVRIICIRQTDLKSLIAYSSVALIGIVIGLIALNILGKRYKLWSSSLAMLIPIGLSLKI